MSDVETEVEFLSAGVHGALAALHLLGAVYAFRRRRLLYAAFHSAWLLLDGYGAFLHARDCAK